jgi:hypothetical protein
MKDKHVIAGCVLFVGALIAIENFYEHPTYGTGLQALYAALKAGEALG